MLAPNRECISDDRPLRFTVERHDFTKVMNESNQMEPIIVRVVRSEVKQIDENSKGKMKDGRCQHDGRYAII